MPIKTIDLCAGIGGMRKGFELTGAFQNVIAAEIDHFACLTYSHLFGEDAFNDLTSDEFKSKLNLISYDVLLAGFPCQTFSKAGQEEGFNDKEKGIIFSHIADIIRRTRPRAVFLENVDNLVRHDKGNTFKIIIETLEILLDYKVVGVTYDAMGKPVYKGKDFVRNSRNFGIPQNRPRTYIMAFDRKRYGTEALLGIENHLPEKNDWYLYEDLNELLELRAEAKYYMASGYLDTLIRHREREHKKGNGFGYRIVNAPGIEHPIANTIMATGGSGKERNLVYDPQEGIAGLMIPGKKTPLNDKGIRVMTPREWGKLQGFINYAFLDENGVDHFSFPEEVSMVQRYKQFGNSVTIPVIETMAEYMLNCFRVLGDIPSI
nr:MAG TPA: Cytosine specific methyltransferase [Caudoviricetes sp.]